MKAPRTDILLGLALLIAHAVAVWGYIGIFWGDIGRWSHEVERFALGELPYRDFQWHYPPLGLWIEGLVARVIGFERFQLSLISTALAAVTVVAAVRYMRSVLQRVDHAFVAVSLILAFAYAQTASAPLPMGLYSPAAIVGTMFTVLAAMTFMNTFSAEPGRNAEWTAVFAALAFLSKQDFWLPALFLLVVSAWRARRLLPLVLFGAIVSLGVALIVAIGGFGILLPLLGGFGHAQVAGGMGFPSWERLTVDILATALISGGVLLLASYARRELLWKPLLGAAAVAGVAAALHVGISLTTVAPEPGSLLTRAQDEFMYHIRAGNSLVRPSIGWLRERVTSNPIPLFLPPLLLGLVAWRWSRLDVQRRTTLAILLAFAIAVRARRAFMGTEWFEFLLTLPIIMLAVETLLGLTETQLRRFRVASLVLLAVLALSAYATMGRGFGTQRYYADATITPRGSVRMEAGQSLQYRRLLATLDSIDARRERPLFAFGFAGGFNYFMQRKNPFPFTQNFFFSAFDADSVLNAPRPEGLLLVDNSALRDANFLSPRFSWAKWEQEPVPAPYQHYDRPRFDRLKRGCEPTADAHGMFQIYVCP